MRPEKAFEPATEFGRSMGITFCISEAVMSPVYLAPPVAGALECDRWQHVHDFLQKGR